MKLYLLTRAIGRITAKREAKEREREGKEGERKKKGRRCLDKIPLCRLDGVLSLSFCFLPFFPPEFRANPLVACCHGPLLARPARIRATFLFPHDLTSVDLSFASTTCCSRDPPFLVVTSATLSRFPVFFCHPPCGDVAL